MHLIFQLQYILKNNLPSPVVNTNTKLCYDLVGQRVNAGKRTVTVDEWLTLAARMQHTSHK